MSQDVVDTLITRLDGDESGYVRAMDRATASAQRFAAADTQAQTAAKRVLIPPVQDLQQAQKWYSQFTDASSMEQYNAATKALGANAAAAGEALGTTLGEGIAAVGTAAVAAAVFCVHASLEAKKLEDSFRGVLGTSEKVKQMMAFLRQQSDDSPFSKSELAGPAAQLLKGGLDANKWLLPIQQLAAGAGRMNSGGLDWAMGLITAAQGGDISRVAGSRGLGEAGITKGDLAAHGAMFDLKGQFQGTADQFMEIMRRTIQDKLGPVLEGMSGGIEQHWAKMLEKLTDLVVPAGDAIITFFTPLVTILDDAAKYAGYLTSALGTLFGSGVSSGAMQASLMQLRDTFRTIAITLGTGLIELGARLKYAALMANPLNFFQGVSLWNETQKQAEYAKTQLALSFRDGGVGAPQPNANGSASWLQGALGFLSKPAEETARHTRRSADALSEILTVQKYIFGGGDLGKLGISAVEYGGRGRGGNHHEVTVRVVGGDIAGLFNSMMADMHRQGYKLVRA